MTRPSSFSTCAGILLLLTASLSVAAVAQVPRTAAELESTPPAELARRVLGDDASAFVEARATRIPGVAQWQGVNLDFASAPRSSGRAGLCTFETASAYFRWNHEQAAASELELQSTGRGRGFALASAKPSLAPAPDDDECRRIGPLLQGKASRDFTVMFLGKPATLEESTFAVAALLTAQSRFPHARCTGDRTLCAGSDRRLGPIDPRRVYRYDVERCSRRTTLCVTALVEAATKNGGISIAIQTEDRADKPVVRVKPSVRAVAVTANFWPVA